MTGSQPNENAMSKKAVVSSVETGAGLKHGFEQDALSVGGASEETVAGRCIRHRHRPPECVTFNCRGSQLLAQLEPLACARVAQRQGREDELIR
jgi:hypothetical protein